MTHKSKIFEKQLIYYSQSNDLDEALAEWEFLESTYNQNHCICSQPIFENCLMKNIHNGHQLIVGNVCVQKFFPKIYKDYNLKDFFSISKKIRSFKLKNLTDDFISKLEDKNLIDDTQRSILHRVLSLKRGWSLPLTEEEFRLFKEVILTINSKLNQNYNVKLNESLEAIRGEIKVLTEEERLESIRQVEERRKQREEWDRRDEELSRQSNAHRLDLLNKCIEIKNYKMPASFDYSFVNNMIWRLQNKREITEKQINAINNIHSKFIKKTINN